MDKFLYIAANSANRIVRAQAVNANNLANVNTTGFRADLEAVRSVSVYGDGYASRAYSESGKNGVDLSTGTMLTTGRTLDVALSKKGYLAVQARDGREAFTRAGSLKVSASGQLVTGTGQPVLGDNGPIAIPPYSKILIGADGTIRIRPKGQKVNALTVVDHLRLVQPDETRLQKNSEGLLILPNGDPQPGSSAQVKVSSGMLESSNVNAIEAIVTMIDLARQFEVTIKLMKEAEDNDRVTNRLLRMNR